MLKVAPAPAPPSTEKLQLPLIETATTAAAREATAIENEPHQYQEFLKYLQSKNKVNGRTRKNYRSSSIRSVSSISSQSAASQSGASSVSSSRGNSILSPTPPPPSLPLHLNGNDTNTTNIDMFVENIILKTENLLLSIHKNMVNIINIELVQCDLQMIRFHCERLQNILLYTEYYKEQVKYR